MSVGAPVLAPRNLNIASWLEAADVLIIISGVPASATSNFFWGAVLPMDTCPF